MLPETGNVFPDAGSDARLEANRPTEMGCQHADTERRMSRFGLKADGVLEGAEGRSLTQIGPLKNRQLQLIVMAELKPPPELIKGEREKCK